MLTILLKLFQKVSYERQKQQSNNDVGYLKIVFLAFPCSTLLVWLFLSCNGFYSHLRLTQIEQLCNGHESTLSFLVMLGSL